MKEASNLISPLVASETKLSVELPERLPLIIADSTRLMQVLFNVLGNAAKFTSSGSITLSARVVGPNLQIKVDDTGECAAQDFALSHQYLVPRHP